MKVILYLTAFACIVLTGCLRTEGTIDIRGKLLDDFTKECIPNRKVVIQGLVYDGTILTPAEAGQFCTDSLGCFSYTMNKTKGAYSYNFIFVGDTEYSISTQEVFLGELETNSKYLSFFLCKLTDFSITIERVSKAPLYDTLYVSWKTNGHDGSTLYPHKLINYGIAPELAFRWIGGNVKSVIETKALANKKTLIRFELFRNGRKVEILDTVYCERNTINNFSFKY